jgi:predicted Rossmann fold nucleotide-binding protein DprA/Smf involved in DNA uptake
VFPVCSLADILVALSLNGVSISLPLPLPLPASTDGGETAAALPEDDRALLDILSPDPASLDQLARLTGLDLPALCGGLERLARAGMARDVGGWWERT